VSALHQVAARVLPERSLRIALLDLERRQKQRVLGQVTLQLKDLHLGVQQVSKLLIHVSRVAF
jgi:hypothetical protein